MQYLVLGWAVAQRDLEVIIKLVGQLCSSARSEGGTTIVVLTQREKLAMEELFRSEPLSGCKAVAAVATQPNRADRHAADSDFTGNGDAHPIRVLFH